MACGIHLLALSETHLDDSFNDEVVGIQGYNIYRRDRNAFGGGVAIFCQNHIPAKIRYDLMPTDIEVLWVQINLPYLKPLLVGCCYRPPSANVSYLDTLCEMLDNACDLDNEIYFLGDLNIDWGMAN